MDSTTEMQVKNILKNGYYRQHQTLGEGGWSNIPRDWKKCCLEAYCPSGLEGEEDLYWDEIEWIVAKDDKTAIKAFHSLYHMEKFLEYDIKEKVVSYRLLETKEQ